MEYYPQYNEYNEYNMDMEGRFPAIVEGFTVDFSDVQAPAEEEAKDAQNQASLMLQKAQLPQGEYAVDHLDHSVLNPLLRPADIAQKNMFPLEMLTAFKKKYYRFDNKLLQCFPGCSRYEDVREARLLGLDHKTDKRTQAWCSGAVQAFAKVPVSVPTDLIHVVGRFLCATPEMAVLPGSDAQIMEVGSVIDRLPETHCVKGGVQFHSQSSSEFIDYAVSVSPSEPWFFNLTLPRHRRNATCAAHKVPLFGFEVLIFVQTDVSRFTLCARNVSAPFEIASVRTLIREVLAFRQQVESAPEPKETTPLKPEAIVTPTTVEQPKVPSFAQNYSNSVARIRLHSVQKSNQEKKKMQVVIVPDEHQPEAMPEIDWMSNEAFTLPPLDPFTLPDICDSDNDDELIPC